MRSSVRQRCRSATWDQELAAVSRFGGSPALGTNTAAAGRGPRPAMRGSLVLDHVSGLAGGRQIDPDRPAVALPDDTDDGWTRTGFTAARATATATAPPAPNPQQPTGSRRCTSVRTASPHTSPPPGPPRLPARAEQLAAPPPTSTSRSGRSPLVAALVGVGEHDRAVTLLTDPEQFARSITNPLMHATGASIMPSLATTALDQEPRRR